MQLSIKELRENVLKLSASERASLAQDLLLSLDDENSYKLSDEYESEIERRITTIKETQAKYYPLDEILPPTE